MALRDEAEVLRRRENWLHSAQQALDSHVLPLLAAVQEDLQLQHAQDRSGDNHSSFGNTGYRGPRRAATTVICKALKFYFARDVSIGWRIFR